MVHQLDPDHLEGVVLIFFCTFRPPGANFLTWFFDDDDDDDDDDELHHLLTCVASPQVKTYFKYHS